MGFPDFADLCRWRELMGRIWGPVRRVGPLQAQNDADEGLYGPHRGDQRADAQDVHDALEIVGQHVQRHLGADLLERRHLA